MKTSAQKLDDALRLWATPELRNEWWPRHQKDGFPAVRILRRVPIGRCCRTPWRPQCGRGEGIAQGLKPFWDAGHRQPASNGAGNGSTMSASGGHPRAVVWSRTNAPPKKPRVAHAGWRVTLTPPPNLLFSQRAPALAVVVEGFPRSLLRRGIGGPPSSPRGITLGRLAGVHWAVRQPEPLSPPVARFEGGRSPSPAPMYYRWREAWLPEHLALRRTASDCPHASPGSRSARRQFRDSVQVEGSAVPETEIGAGGVSGCSGMPGSEKVQPARQSSRIQGGQDTVEGHGGFSAPVEKVDFNGSRKTRPPTAAK